MKQDIEVKLSLHPGQRKVFDSKARFIVCVAGRRFGKSWLACVRAITSALDERNVLKMPVGLIAPTYPTARTIYWRRLLQMGGKLVVNSNVNLGIIELVNGVEIHIKGADRPDSLRGVGWWDVVIDEYADQKAEIWELIVSPALSDAALYGGGRALFIGTPKGRNHFYKIAQDAIEDTTGEWEFFNFASADNPFLLAQEIESARKRMSSAAFRQEYMASFESSGGAVFQRSWIKYGPEPKDGRFYIAVDLAGFSEVEKQSMLSAARADATTIAVVKAHDGKWWVADMIHGRWGIKETALRIAQAVKKYEPVALGIERGALHKAVEPYLIESMQRLGALVPVTPLTHGNKSKTDRIVWALQGRFEHGNITLAEGAPWVDNFLDELINFPAKSVHDDMPDALSYIDQLVIDTYWTTVEDPVEPWEPMDAIAGY